MFMDPDRVEERTGSISSHVDRTSWVNKGSIIQKMNIIFSRDTASNPDWALLPAQAANHSAGFIILPANITSHITMLYILASPCKF